jgi:hypothetical protein
MTTVTLKYKPNNIFAQKMLDVLLVSGAFSVEKKSKKSELQKSIEEARKGRVYTAKNAKDLIAQCLQ